ncbi:MAG: type II secretion system GspH family protein [Polyangiaceae bacterium]|nr:type II secretion system GspH family protein [Polyangiaceae bacterium]
MTFRALVPLSNWRMKSVPSSFGASRRSRAFTLLEVMVALAIVGLGMTVVLSSQAGLFHSARVIQNEAYATSLLRCKMSEIELQLLKKGFSQLDQNDSGECCEDEDEPGFACEWKIETIEMPPIDAFTENSPGTDEEDDETGLKFGAGSDPLSQLTGGDVGSVSNATELGEALSQNSSAGPGGMIQMALQLVYPGLKPMLEASIRKITVTVKWQQGRKEREFSVSQFVTNPAEGALSPNAADDIGEGGGIDSLLNGDSDSEGEK